MQNVKVMKEKDALYAKEDFTEKDGERQGNWKIFLPRWMAGTLRVMQLLC